MVSSEMSAQWEIPPPEPEATAPAPDALRTWEAQILEIIDAERRGDGATALQLAMQVPAVRLAEALDDAINRSSIEVKFLADAVIRAGGQLEARQWQARLLALLLLDALGDDPPSREARIRYLYTRYPDLETWVQQLPEQLTSIVPVALAGPSPGGSRG